MIAPLSVFIKKKKEEGKVTSTLATILMPTVEYSFDIRLLAGAYFGRLL